MKRNSEWGKHVRKYARNDEEPKKPNKARRHGNEWVRMT